MTFQYLFSNPCFYIVEVATLYRSTLPYTFRQVSLISCCPLTMNSDTVVLIAAIALIQALFSWWIQARLSASIKHEYDKKLEQLKREQDQRHKAAAIAELLAEWTHVKDDTKKLNQLLWEFCLYLPASLVKDLQATVSNAPGHKSAPQLIVSIRQQLLGPADPIEEQDVGHFKLPSNSSMLSTPAPKK